MMERLRPVSSRLLEEPARFFYEHGITPTFFTLLGLVFAILAGISYSFLELWWAFVFVIIAGIADMIDGSIARLYPSRTKAGGLMDSVIDRLAEVGIYTGLVFAFTNKIDQLLVMLTLIMSLMTSYIRAKAESLGAEMRGIGLMERGERVVGLLLFTMLAAIIEFKYLRIGIYVLFLLTSFTVIQRFWIAHKRLNMYDVAP